MNATTNNNFKVLQIVQISDWEKFKSSVAFDQNGKLACNNYFRQILKTLKDYRFVYYPNSKFKRTESYQYKERFLKIQNDTLVEVASFDDCDFYECSFCTSTEGGNDIGIVSFIDYTILNTDENVEKMILLTSSV